MKATQDFTEDGVSVKAGEEIQPGAFEADRLQSLLASGLVVDEKNKTNKPVAKAGKGKSK
jgi:hypothetical protein